MFFPICTLNRYFSYLVPGSVSDTRDLKIKSNDSQSLVTSNTNNESLPRSELIFITLFFCSLHSSHIISITLFLFLECPHWFMPRCLCTCFPPSDRKAYAPYFNCWLHLIIQVLAQVSTPGDLFQTPLPSPGPQPFFAMWLFKNTVVYLKVPCLLMCLLVSWICYCNCRIKFH